MKTKIEKKYEGKIIAVLINFGNETFRVGYSKKYNHWLMWRKEKNPLPFTNGMWLLNVNFQSLKKAKKYIKDRKYLMSELRIL